MGIGLLATLMLGHYSDLAAAGGSIANLHLSMFILLFNVTAIGTMILIGQQIGEQQHKKARQLARSALSLNF